MIHDPGVVPEAWSVDRDNNFRNVNFSVFTRCQVRMLHCVSVFTIISVVLHEPPVRPKQSFLSVVSAQISIYYVSCNSDSRIKSTYPSASTC